jgi:FtsP/CotA-like multicopper oxidase with cupredoxin domain
MAAFRLAMPLASPSPTPPPSTACNTPPTTTEIANPPELRSVNGVVSVTLTVAGDPNPANIEGMCWFYQLGGGAGTQWVPPTFHVKQGDRMVINLVNDMLRPPPSADAPAISIDKTPGDSMDGMQPAGKGNDGIGLMCGQPQLSPTPTPDPVTGRIYGYHRSPWNDTNLHFHGLNVSPKQPSDDVVNVLLCPRRTQGEAAKSFTYTIDIPRDEPPGLYWYHPHPHGESERQVLSQMTGVIVIDPLVPSAPQKLFNRIIIVRDLGALGSIRPAYTKEASNLRQLVPTLPAIRKNLAKFGTSNADFNLPAWRFGPPENCPTSMKPHLPRFNTKALLVNEIPLPPRPNQPGLLPQTTMTLGSTEYWRFANTSSDTVLDVELLVNGKPSPLMIVERDGVPIVIRSGQPTWQPVPMDHVRLPPASRMEFYLTASAPGNMVLRTHTIDAGCLGDTALERDLLIVHVKNALHRTVLPRVPVAIDPVKMRFSDLPEQKPVKHRYFAFTEYNRTDEHEPDWYITEISNPNAVETPFDPRNPPAVTVKDGTVEDWTILNYTLELHEFHMHQIHFFVMQSRGIEYGQNQTLDMIEVPFGSLKYSSSNNGYVFRPGAVTVRMDFRDPTIVGDFVYHCHILSHEDNGMMAKIRVVK